MLARRRGRARRRSGRRARLVEGAHPLTTIRPEDLLVATPDGLHCPGGDFHVDPWRPVERAIITHAHADHARPGSKHYLALCDGEQLLRARLGSIALETLAAGERRQLGDVTVSLHHAGHVLGSSQVRIEHRGATCVFTGDFKRVRDAGEDPTCSPFEPLRCDHLISECTFGLPVYRWPDAREEMGRLRAWWARCREAERTAIVGVYALGKAQRLAALLADAIEAGDGPLLLHGAVAKLFEAYEASGVALPDWSRADVETAKTTRGSALVLAPPSALGSVWTKRFGRTAHAFASGWMRIRGVRRRRNVERGFVLSDHADWDGLLRTFGECGAASVDLTHGFGEPMRRYLSETTDLRARVLPTRFTGEGDDEGDDDAGSAS